DSRTRNAVMTRIAVQFAGFGKSDRGVEIALENQNPDEQISALSQIAQILTTQKEDELARQTVNLIADDANRLFGLVAMSDAKSKLGETDDATALLDEAAGLSHTVEQLGARSNVLNEIASRYADSGQVEKAGTVSLENLGVIVEIRDESSKAAALAGLSAIYDRASLSLGEREKGFLIQLVRKSDL
ncbi:MAG: hypothetical protein ABIV48_04735, partial [Pyrinomonadaceae bacterium]